MSDYKRFISYLYCYENGIKKNNIGYARVETRNGQCKITIHIKLLSISNKVLDTYLFYRKEQRIIGLPLCPLTVKNSVGDCQVFTSSDKVLDSTLPFYMIGGIIILVSQNRLLGTEWDDIPIVPSAFEIEKTKSLYVADLEAEPEKSEESEGSTEPTEAVIKASQEPFSQPEPLLGQEEPKEQEEQKEQKEQEEPPKTEEKSFVMEEAASSVENVAQEEGSISEAALPAQAKQLEAIVPEALNTITNYLLIEPAYIDHLSMEYAGLKQNSFLLHGYGSYRHLILAKWPISSQVSAAEASDGLEIENFDIFYQLGVPGIYSSREKAIAEKFGFAEFKTTKGTPLKYGDFGYWLVPVAF